MGQTWGDILVEIGNLNRVHAGGGLPNGWSPFDYVRRKYIKQLSARTKRPLIVYATQWTHGSASPELTSITSEDIHGLMEVVHGLPGDELDIVLHSPGGSPEATEAMVNYLRSKFRDIRVFIPQAAMSAATMLACAADRIVMGKHSSLGPIDPQFILRTENGLTSAAAHAILEQFTLAQEQCRDPALLPSWLPILRMYGPALIVQCQLAQKLSKSLVEEWLARFMFKGKPDATEIADRVAATLADHAKFMSHGRFISRDQAKSIGLVVEDLEVDHDLQNDLLGVFHAVAHTLDATPTVKIIENNKDKAYIKSVQTILVPGPNKPQPAAAPPTGALPPMPA